MTNDVSKVTEDSARGGFFLFSGSAIATVIMAISSILVGRFLGPELYGQYNLVLVIPTLLVLLTDFGVNVGITKFAASLRAEGKIDRAVDLIRHGTYFKLAIGLVAAVLSVVFAGYFALIINRPDYGFFIQIASVSVLFQVIFTTVNSAFVGLDRSEYTALSTNVQAVTKTVLQIVLVLLGFSVAGALVGYVGGFVVGSIFGVVLLFVKFLKPVRTSGAGYLGQSFKQNVTVLTRYGLPVYVAVVLIGFLPQYQQVILAFFASDAIIGNFKAATNFVSLLTIIPASLTTALLPAFSKLESAPDDVNGFFKRATKYICLLIVPTTMLIILFSNQIVQLVYGSVYDLAALFLSVNALVYFLVALGYLSVTSLFNGVGKTRLTLNMTLINFVLALVLYPVFAQLYGVVGVIVASFIAVLAASVYGAFVAVRRLKVNFDFKQTLRIYLAAAVSVFPSLGLLLFAPLSSLVMLAVGALLYLFVFVTLLPLFKVVTSDELRALSKLTAGIPLLGLLVAPLLKYEQKILALINQRKKPVENTQ